MKKKRKTCKICKKKIKNKNKVYCSRLCQSKDFKYGTKYRTSTFRIIAKKVLPFECAICGWKELGLQRLLLHHIDGNPLNNPNNGSNWMFLCRSHHVKLHFLLHKMNHANACNLMTKEMLLASRTEGCQKINIFAKN